MNILQFLIDFQTKGDSGAAASVGKLQNNLDNARRSTESLTSRIGGSLKSAIMSLPGAEFFTNPLVQISAGIAAVTKLGMTNEQTAISFEVLLGSQKKAAALMKEMKGYANTTPYESADIFQNAKTMLGFGVSLEKVMPYMKMLGNVAMGDKEKLSSLTLAFSQISAAGKLQGQDLLQLINAGYNPLQDISQMTGKSIAKLKDEMESGKISFEMVAGAFQHATSQGGRFYEMTDRIGKTAGGKLSTLIDSLKEKMLILYGAVVPILIPALDSLAIVLDSIATPLQWIVDKFNAFIGVVKSGIDLLATGNPIMWGMVAAIAAYTIVVNGLNIAMAIWTGITKIATAIQWLFNAALAMSGIGLVVALIAGLTVAAVICWNKFAGFRAFLLTMWDVIKGFGNLIKNFVIDRITGIISGIGLLGKSLLKLFKGDFKGAWEDAKNGASGILGIDAAKNAVKNYAAIPKWSDAYNKNLSQQNALQKTKDATDKKGASDSKIKNKATLSPTNTKNGATESAVTGGTRNNIITVNIGKLIENLIVHQFDKMNTRDFEAMVVESMTRAIEIATSSAR